MFLGKLRIEAIYIPLNEDYRKGLFIYAPFIQP